MARKRLMQSAVAAAVDEAPTRTTGIATPRTRRLDPMAAREGALADVASGKVRDVRLRLVDPSVCRMWERHNRIYELLTPGNCGELISSIRAQGKQEVPAVVRRLRDDPDGYEYEVVAGARRHFAITHLREEEHRKELFFLVEVKELEDEEAFRYSDLENRNRKDISDYERGKEYAAAMQEFYGGNATRMAERMEISKALLSSYLSVARLPEEVIAAYGDPREVAVRHGQKLSPLLNGTGRAEVIERARVIAETQVTAREGGRPLLKGQDVFRLLTGTLTREQPVVTPFKTADGRTVLTAKRAKGRVVLDVDLRASEDEVLAAVRDVLRGKQG